MKIINFIGNSSAIVIIGSIILMGIFEKKNIFSYFTIGVKKGGQIILELFPTLIGLFVAVGMLSSSGVIEFVSENLYKFLKEIIIFEEIIPLAILRPISGSTSIAIGIDIMQKVRSRFSSW